MTTRSFNNKKPRKPFYQSHYRKPGSFGLGRRNHMGGNRKTIDFTKFVNKAIQTNEAEAYVVQHRFADFKIDHRIFSTIESKGYETPTPIQDRIIPCIIDGSDVVGIADTGTGKTAAFLLPLINKILQNQREKVLIITPTRELAIQIESEFKQFARGMGIFSVCCVGGMNIGRQISALYRNYNLIVGTPGRIKDLTERKKINLSLFSSVVLDEADRMFDMGFIKDTRLIMNKLPRVRQTLFFSATLSNDIERIINEFTNNPVRVSLKTRDTSKNVEQDVIRVNNGKTKLEILNELLAQKEFNKVLIFGRTKHGVEKLSRSLYSSGFKAESIHGNKNNSQRQKALGMFKDNRVNILVATDVAARGIDIADISHVINYDVPATYEDYIHRIGRTGRCNKKGIALTFID
jgi:superfamily II DNA/RNA helicase